MCENFYRVINKKVYKNSFHTISSHSFVSKIKFFIIGRPSQRKDLHTILQKKKKKQKQEESVRTPKTVKTRKQKRHKIHNNINHAFVLSGAAGAVNKQRRLNANNNSPALAVFLSLSLSSPRPRMSMTLNCKAYIHSIKHLPMPRFGLLV